MKEYYLIVGMDKLNGSMFYPGPCLFNTEQEAIDYIRLNEDDNTKYMRRKVAVGKMKYRYTPKELENK